MVRAVVAKQKLTPHRSQSIRLSLTFIHPRVSTLWQK